MKLFTLLFPLFFSFLSLSAQNTIKIEGSKEVSISRDELKVADFSSKESTYNFIINTILKPSKMEDVAALRRWSAVDGMNLNQSAILFIRHDYTKSRLQDLSAPAKEALDKLINLVPAYEQALKDGDKWLIQLKLGTITTGDADNLVKNSNYFTDDEKAALSPFHFTAAVPANQQHFIEIFTNNLKRLKEVTLPNAIAKIQKDEPTIIEEPAIVTTLLHKEKGEWSDYLLKTKKILVILLGGEEDIAKASIEIENTVSAMDASLADLKSLAQALAMSAKTGIKCKVIALSPDGIIPPSTLTIKHAAFKEAPQYKIHETGNFLFKVGVSATYLDKNTYKIENQELVIAPDPDQQKVWKENLVAMVEYSFAPRDYDRFGSFFSKDDKTPRLNRFGLFAGCKLSKKPWELLTMGGSFALSNTVSVNGGLSFALKEGQQTVDVGEITDLEDARKLADQEYQNAKWFIGLSFSPKIITKALGLEKEKK
ncbi:hypothetical protein [Hufsiella ginkgonis]|uniref:Uncharacterized protein n=1 Tax=Hufsiella ginkgonis TaxID=2695274 RepID=A0A7K1XZR4_9SPHI|nr:hypothetical protein [Hufsiella ginkgonis]MXV16501.1 hypothetical protein [Hufsiella ginkgonis]